MICFFFNFLFVLSKRSFRSAVESVDSSSNINSEYNTDSDTKPQISVTKTVSVTETNITELMDTDSEKCHSDNTTANFRNCLEESQHAKDNGCSLQESASAGDNSRLKCGEMTSKGPALDTDTSFGT